MWLGENPRRKINNCLLIFTVIIQIYSNLCNKFVMTIHESPRILSIRSTPCLIRTHIICLIVFSSSLLGWISVKFNTTT